ACGRNVPTMLPSADKPATRAMREHSVSGKAFRGVPGIHARHSLGNVGQPQRAIREIRCAGDEASHFRNDRPVLVAETQRATCLRDRRPIFSCKEVRSAARLVVRGFYAADASLVFALHPVLSPAKFAMKTLIKNGVVVLPDGIERLAVVIDGARIEDI